MPLVVDVPRQRRSQEFARGQKRGSGGQKSPAGPGAEPWRGSGAKLPEAGDTRIFYV